MILINLTLIGILIAAVIYVFGIMLPFQTHLAKLTLSKLDNTADEDRKAALLHQIDKDVSWFLRPLIKDWIAIERFR